MREENIAVYESLRNEIIATQGVRANMIVYMYTVYIALFALGVERGRVFFVISYVILISFQAKINRCKYTIARISTYIRVFFEEERDDMHWETTNTVGKRPASKLKADNEFISFLSGMSTVQLGIISFICFCVSVVLNYDEKVGLLCSDIILCVASVVCIVILAYVNNDYKVKKEDITEMAREYRNYKKKVFKAKNRASK